MRMMSIEEAVNLPARLAGLSYVTDDEPGIRRQKRGNGFEFRNPDGSSVTDAATRMRIRKLAIPPAWTEVWICPDPEGHVQATGRDAKRRKQYKYHASWRELRDANKFDHILDFARLLPAIRRRVAADMALPGVTRDKVRATIVGLLDTTLVRVGNDEYAKENGSFGLTTLHGRHVKVVGTELRFHFKGKSGRVWKLTVKHRRIARIMRAFQDLPGQRLFQYQDGDGVLRTIASGDINDYLREITGAEITAKDFRTWAGTVLAAIALGAVGPSASETEAKRKIKQAVTAVADRLGNTPTICRKCYVHPAVIEGYRAGTLPSLAGEEPGSVEDALSRDERRVLAMLREASAKGKPTPRSAASMAHVVK